MRKAPTSLPLAALALLLLPGCRGAGPPAAASPPKAAASPAATATGVAAESPGAGTGAGTGAGARAGASHVGSARCAPCHAAISAEWAASSHATTVRVADDEDLDRVESFIECSELFFTHALGDRHHVRYLVEKEETAWGSGRWLALPCGWDVHESEVTLHHPDGWKDLPWETSCAGCHVTGFQSKDHSFLEFGVGCEECHGPGSEHAVSARKDLIFGFAGRSARDEVTVCASCHLQGGRSKSTGLKLAPAYQPGDALFDDYEFDWSEVDSAGADALVLDLHQKRVIRDVVVKGEEGLRCTSCHELHGLGHAKHRSVPKQDFCTYCHQPDFSLKEYSQSCNVCEF